MKRPRTKILRSIVDGCSALDVDASNKPMFATDAIGVPQCAVVRFAAVVNSRPILRRHITELAPAHVAARAVERSPE